MSEDEIESNGVATPSTERHAIGISFGNSNSSIAYTSGVSTRHSATGKERLNMVADLRGAYRTVKQKSSPTKKEVSEKFHVPSIPQIVKLRRVYRPPYPVNIVIYRGGRIPWHAGKGTTCTQQQEHRSLFSRLPGQRVSAELYAYTERNR